MAGLLYLPEAAESGDPGFAYFVRLGDGGTDPGREGDPKGARDGGRKSGREDDFDGPFELLLRMVRDGRADPLRIEVADLVRQYLDAIEVIETIDLRLGAGFLKMAAALLRIKAFRLLPRERPDSDAPDSDALAEELQRRFLEYQKYRDAAEHLDRAREARSSVFVRPVEATGAASIGDADAGEGVPEGAEELDVDLFAVVEAFRRVVERARERPPVPRPERQIPVHVVIRRIEAAVRPGARCAFETVLLEVLEGDVSRPVLVAAFLAVLELARRRRIRIEQERDFGPIWIEGLEAPTAG